MKKILTMLIAASFLTSSWVYADNTTDAANMRIQLKGALRNNTYFLCMPDLGCLSILAASQGKVYSFVHAIQMDNLYVTDIEKNFRVSPQGLPDSCQGVVKENQTITIYGTLVPNANGTTYVKNLHCAVS